MRSPVQGCTLGGGLRGGLRAAATAATGGCKPVAVAERAAADRLEGNGGRTTAVGAERRMTALAGNRYEEKTRVGRRTAGRSLTAKKNKRWRLSAPARRLEGQRRRLEGTAGGPHCKKKKRKSKGSKTVSVRREGPAVRLRGMRPCGRDRMPGPRPAVWRR